VTLKQKPYLFLILLLVGGVPSAYAQIVGGTSAAR